MHAFIFANGNLDFPVKLTPDELVIAADGGAHHCISRGIQPAYVIGDLDSLSEQEVAALEADGAQIVRFPARKDYTDLELAIRHALDLGARDITLYGALGARWDQTTANLLLATAFPEARINLVDGDQEMFYLRGGETRTIPAQAGDIVSLIPLGEKAEGITTHNLEYALNEGTLRAGSTRGVSNVALEGQASVSLRTGWLLCVVIHQRP